MSEWQPIETAPKDGTEIIAWRAGRGQFIARWTCAADLLTDDEQKELDDVSLFSEDWFGADFVSGFRADGSEAPTHWHPLGDPTEADDITPLWSQDDIEKRILETLHMPVHRAMELREVLEQCWQRAAMAKKANNDKALLRQALKALEALREVVQWLDPPKSTPYKTAEVAIVALRERMEPPR